MRTACVLVVLSLMGVAPAAALDVTWVSFHTSDDPSADGAAAGLTEAADKPYTDLLTANGANVTRFETHEPLTPEEIEQLNDSDLVIIGRSVNSGAYDPPTDWNTNVTAPVIITSGYLLRSNRLNLTDGTTMQDTTGPIRLRADVPAHPIFKGISLNDSNEMTNPYAEIVFALGQDQRGLSINMSNVVGGTLIASVADDGNPTAGGPIIAEWDAGATLNNGEVLASRRLAYLTGSREVSGVSGHTAGLFDLSEDGAQMFLNAVDYVVPFLGPPVVPGDVDGNEVVDFADYEIIRENFFNAVTSREMGDLNRDGVVEWQDFREWKDNRTLAVAGAAAIPEPATLVLALLALGSLSVRGRPCRRALR